MFSHALKGLIVRALTHRCTLAEWDLHESEGWMVSIVGRPSSAAEAGIPPKHTGQSFLQILNGWHVAFFEPPRPTRVWEGGW